MNRSLEMWPGLQLDEWEPTYRTVHRVTQMLGKIAIAHAPRLNHWWGVTLHVTPRGLTTPVMDHGEKRFDIKLDFIAHELRVTASDGSKGTLALESISVAEYYERLMALLGSLGLPVQIWTTPVEVSDPVPFEKDSTGTYDREAIARCHQALLQVDRVFRIFRGRFLGKSSPSHFFWGAFDHALTRFSGRENPNPPEDSVMAHGYSHELISHGWWPGGDWPMGGRIETPIFYAYAVPEPPGFRDAKLPAGGRYDETFGEYVLEYDAVRSADDPDALLLEFMQRTYEAGADAGGWDRTALERRGD